MCNLVGTRVRAYSAVDVRAWTGNLPRLTTALFVPLVAVVVVVLTLTSVVPVVTFASPVVMPVIIDIWWAAWTGSRSQLLTVVFVPLLAVILVVLAVALVVPVMTFEFLVVMSIIIGIG